VLLISILKNHWTSGINRLIILSILHVYVFKNEFGVPKEFMQKMYVVQNHVEVVEDKVVIKDPEVRKSVAMGVSKEAKRFVKTKIQWHVLFHKL
jgi:hypothetical protein